MAGMQLTHRFRKGGSDFGENMSSACHRFIHLYEKISASAAYMKLYPTILATPSVIVHISEMAEKMNLIQSSDTDFLDNIIKEVIGNNPEKVTEYKKGRKGLVGFFVGEVMKLSKGKAEPKATNVLVLRELEK